ncbi:MAG: hypothetical protein Q7T32_04580 [Moraxellaceae bacterium]|nr:hypothetical protein [Moraxellaceae bacterium]
MGVEAGTHGAFMGVGEDRIKCLVMAAIAQVRGVSHEVPVMQ